MKLDTLQTMMRRLTAKLTTREILIGAGILLSLIAFYWGFLAHMSTTFKGGDFDQQAQYYEAARISILHYHQFPFWNPWESGGMPLFTNPQYGILSLQSLTTLVFGTFAGLKIAYLTYALVGFTGMYVLCRRVFVASKFRSLLLSYIWIFCAFYSYHSIDHLGFSLIHFLPWLLYIFVNRQKRLYWLWFGLIVSIMLLTYPHYGVMMCGLLLLLLWLWENVFVKITSARYSLGINLTRQDWQFFLKSGLLIFVLSAYRMIGTYDFIKNEPRLASDLYEPTNSPLLILYALFAPAAETHIPTNTHWGWGEYSGYMGLGVSLIVLLMGITYLKGLLAYNSRAKLRKAVSKLLIKRGLVTFLVLMGILSFVLALGNFASFSPMGLLHHLPGFDQTRVASRWVIICIFAILCIIASWQKQTRVVNVLLLVSVIELFCLFHAPSWFFSAHTYAQHQYGSSFHQVINPRYDRLMGPGGSYSDKSLDSLYVNTIRNQGSIFTDDPLVNTTVSAPTVRCDNKLKGNCDFIISHNAKVFYWSPNKIVLERTGPGKVEIDMNPGSYWLVNNARLPVTTNTLPSPAKSGERFIIYDKSKTITLEIVPKYTLQNVWRILTH